MSNLRAYDESYPAAVYAAPTIATLVPTTRVQGSAPTALQVNGTGFVSGADVFFAGTKLSTTYVSPTQVTTTIPTSLLTTGVKAVTVRNANGRTSASSPFTVTATGQQQEEEPPFDPEPCTIAEVLDYVDEHPGEVRRVLRRERRGKNRTTLVAELEARRDA